MRVALDTNRLSDLLRGDEQLADLLSICDEIWVPLIVLAEVKAGFLGGTRPERNEILLSRLLAKEAVGILVPDRETAGHYARLYQVQRRAGRPVPDNDLWIAALAVQHDLPLISRDRHFDFISQVQRIEVAKAPRRKRRQ